MNAEELNELKGTLRALVVSTPTQVDLRTLLRDYRSLMGKPLPTVKFGYNDPLQFLQEKFTDCFEFHGYPGNPTLKLIVTENIKHIDNMVQRQKMSSSNRTKGRRSSVPAPCPRPPPCPKRPPAMVKPATPAKVQTELRRSEYKKETVEREATMRNLNASINKLNIVQDKDNRIIHNGSNHGSQSAVSSFLKKRLPVLDHTECFDDNLHEDDSKTTSTSSPTILSSSSSSKQSQLEELRAEVTALVIATPGGVWCKDLIRLYRDKYGRELNFSRYGYNAIAGFAVSLTESGALRLTRPTGDDWLLCDVTGPNITRPEVRRHPSVHRTASQAQIDDIDDALPGVDFDPEVFPADCMHFMESVPALPLNDLVPGSTPELILGEVYSPSHFWFIRLGQEYNIAMENMMDEMCDYYTSGEGKERTLAVGAVRVGHYCSSVYEGDWHRALIVQRVDSDTVKVRHIDYGTVDRVRVTNLKPLLRCWSSLPAQAIRGRLAGVRPPAGGRRWPHAAAAYFLRLVGERPLVGSVIATDEEENVVELFLVDTKSSREDILIDEELIRSGHADARPDSAFKTESYLYPRFEALESGATPNYAEIHAYLRNGISLDYVPEYANHVPTGLLSMPRALHFTQPAPRPVTSEPDSPPTLSDSSSPASSPVEFVNRVPVLSLLNRAKSPDCIDPAHVLASSPPPPPPSQEMPSASPRRPISPSQPPDRPRQRSLVSAPSLSQFFPPTSLPYQLPPVFPPPMPSFGPPPFPFYMYGGYPPPPPPPQFYRSCPRLPPQFFYPHSGPACPSPGPGPGPDPGPGPWLHQSAHTPPRPLGPVNHTRGDAKTQGAKTHSPHRQASMIGFRPIRKAVRRLSVDGKETTYQSQTLDVSRQTPPREASSQTTQQEVTRQSPALETDRLMSSPQKTNNQSPLKLSRESPPRDANYVANTVLNGATTERRFTTTGGDVTLSVAECEIFRLLSRVDSNAAHWYMVDAIRRAMGGGASMAAETTSPRSALNPEAREFQLPVAGRGKQSPLLAAERRFLEDVHRSATSVRPPPGFGD